MNEIVKAVKLLYNHIYGRYDQEMPEVKKLVDDALVLDGDEYTREIWNLRDKLQEKEDELQEKLQEKDRQISELKKQLELLQKK